MIHFSFSLQRISAGWNCRHMHARPNLCCIHDSSKLHLVGIWNNRYLKCVFTCSSLMEFWQECACFVQCDNTVFCKVCNLCLLCTNGRNVTKITTEFKQSLTIWSV